MKTIKVQFMSQGELIKRTAILDDRLDTLSTNKRNQATHIEDEYKDEGYWIILFENEKENIIYEVEFKYDGKENSKTLEPIKAITWENDIIADVQKARIAI